MSRDFASLLDIDAAIGRALAFVGDLDFETFSADARTQWAVWSQIVIIGEAAMRSSQQFQSAHPELPWKEMIGMRRRLVHGYDRINWVRVWETLCKDLPAIRAVLTPLLPKEESA